MTQLTKNMDSAQAKRILETSFKRMFPRQTATIWPTVFSDVELMFAGKYLDYQANDTPYHNLRHTLEVAVCFNNIMEGRHAASIEPILTARQYELGLIAVLLHDTGYLKLRADLSGTGAKYTFTHVIRSCSVASSYLPAKNVSLTELEAVMSAIRCTSAARGSQHFHFHEPIEGIVGCAVATADYLAQMAAPDYPEMLSCLFAELEESDNFANVPPSERRYHTCGELLADTASFWRHNVMPRLERELLGMYRFLARPYPNGSNPYIDAINVNIERIEQITRENAKGSPGTKAASRSIPPFGRTTATKPSGKKRSR